MCITPTAKRFSIVCRALDEVLGYAQCTDVQAASIPVAMRGQDVVCKAKTGTGKTIAFLVPAIEQVSASEGFALAPSMMSILQLNTGCRCSLKEVSCCSCRDGRHHQPMGRLPALCTSCICLGPQRCGAPPLQERVSKGKGLVMMLTKAVIQMQLMQAGPRRGETAILVVSPTRELAAQIAVEAQALSKFHGLTTQVHKDEC